MSDLSLFLEWFDYNPGTGDLRWKKNKGRKRAGDIAGKAYTGLGGKTYGQVKLNQKLYMTHRVCFLIHNGFMPDEVDHKNGNGADNRACNLRPATRKTNSMNMRKFATNTSGVTGVSWDKRNKRWYSYIKVNQVMMNLGRFSDKFDAICARKSAEAKYKFKPSHGEDRAL